MNTTTPPDDLDAQRPEMLNAEGTEEQVNTDPPKTTGPMPAREAWAMYERGEATLLDLERLYRPTSKEVA